MIQTQTLLKVSDNSGGKAVRCLKLLKKGNNPKIASSTVHERLQEKRDVVFTVFK